MNTRTHDQFDFEIGGDFMKPSTNPLAKEQNGNTICIQMSIEGDNRFGRRSWNDNFGLFEDLEEVIFNKYDSSFRQFVEKFFFENGAYACARDEFMSKLGKKVEDFGKTIQKLGLLSNGQIKVDVSESDYVERQVMQTDEYGSVFLNYATEREYSEPKPIMSHTYKISDGKTLGD